MLIQLLLIHFPTPQVFAYVLFLTSFLLVEMQPKSFWEAPSPKKPLYPSALAPVERGVVIFYLFHDMMQKKAKPNYKNTNQFTIVYQDVHGKQW